MSRRKIAASAQSRQYHPDEPSGSDGRGGDVLGQGPVRTGELLWQPHAERVRSLESHARSCVGCSCSAGGVSSSYEALWEWSVTDLDGFWAAIWDYFLVRPSVPYSRVLARRQMPGAQWFPGARLELRRARAAQ